MKYNHQSIQELHELEGSMIQLKEYYLCLEKKKLLKKQLILHHKNEERLQQVKRELHHVLIHQKRLEQRKIHQTECNPHEILSKYFSAYGVSLCFLSKVLQVDLELIKSYISTGSLTRGAKPLIAWSIKNFRIDPFLFESILLSSYES